MWWTSQSITLFSSNRRWSVCSLVGPFSFHGWLLVPFRRQRAKPAYQSWCKGEVLLNHIYATRNSYWPQLGQWLRLFGPTYIYIYSDINQRKESSYHGCHQGQGGRRHHLQKPTTRLTLLGSTMAATKGRGTEDPK